MFLSVLMCLVFLTGCDGASHSREEFFQGVSKKKIDSPIGH